MEMEYEVNFGSGYEVGSRGETPRQAAILAVQAAHCDGRVDLFGGPVVVAVSGGGLEEPVEVRFAVEVGGDVHEMWSGPLMVVKYGHDGRLDVHGGAELDAEQRVRAIDALRHLLYARDIGDGDLESRGFSRRRDGCLYWERFGVVMRVEEHRDHHWAQIRPAEHAAREPYTRPAGVMGEVRA